MLGALGEQIRPGQLQFTDLSGVRKGRKRACGGELALAGTRDASLGSSPPPLLLTPPQLQLMISHMQYMVIIFKLGYAWPNSVNIITTAASAITSLSDQAIKVTSLGCLSNDGERKARASVGERRRSEEMRGEKRDRGGCE